MNNIAKGRYRRVIYKTTAGYNSTIFLTENDIYDEDRNYFIFIFVIRFLIRSIDFKIFNIP